MTGNSAVLLPVFVSPGTGFTSTRRLTSSPNGSVGKLRNVTVFVSPGSMMSIVCFFTIDCGCFGIVSVTSTPTSCESPVSVTDTSNARSVDAWIVVSVPAVSCCPLGSTRTPAMPVPCRPVGVPPVGRAVDALPDRRQLALRGEVGRLDELRARAPRRR